jgi:hypothetical protein
MRLDKLSKKWPPEHYGSAPGILQHLHGGEYAQMPKRHFTMQETLAAIILRPFYRGHNEMF